MENPQYFINVSNEEISDKKSMAEKLNSFFVQIRQLKHHIAELTLNCIFKILLTFFEKIIA